MGIFAISNGASSNGKGEKRANRDAIWCAHGLHSRARVCAVCEPSQKRSAGITVAKNGLKRTEKRETKEKKGMQRCK